MCEVGLAYQFVQPFALMVRTRTGGQLDAWLASVFKSSLRDFHPIRYGIGLDIEAVEAGLILLMSAMDRWKDR
jgi:hypothetical protein